jgi:hypothetical protein
LNSLAHADLNRFNVLIFPDDDSGDGGSYSSVLDSVTVDRISRWVAAGGVFTGLRGGAAWATQEQSGLSSIHLKASTAIRRVSSLMSAATRRRPAVPSRRQATT